MQELIKCLNGIVQAQENKEDVQDEGGELMPDQVAHGGGGVG